MTEDEQVDELLDAARYNRFPFECCPGCGTVLDALDLVYKRRLAYKTFGWYCWECARTRPKW